jgi:hypothetical protein
MNSQKKASFRISPAKILKSPLEKKRPGPEKPGRNVSLGTAR